MAMTEEALIRLKDQILADPAVILDDDQLMRALLAADRRAVAGRNVVDLRGVLVERLEERLGRPEAIRYDLAYTITTETVGVGITTDNKITRYNLKGVVDYTLTERATGARVTGGRVQSFTAYSATGSTVAGLAAEEDAGLRLMRILADQIVARLIAASASLP